MIEKYVDASTFYMREEKLKKACPDGYISIHYASNYYRDDVQYILELRDEVLKDYPNMRERDMIIWVIGNHESIRHARVTTLLVKIPVDDYLKLRKEGNIGIR